MTPWYELAPSQKHRPNLGTALHQKVIHHHECAQVEIKVVTEDRQSMRLQVRKLQADTERDEEFVSEAWEAPRASEEQRHSDATHRHAEKADSSEEPERVRDTHTSATEPIESPSVNHRDDGEESSEGRSSVAAAGSTVEGRPEAVRVAVTEDGCRAEPARGQRRGTHLGFGTFWNRRANGR